MKKLILSLSLYSFFILGLAAQTTTDLRIAEGMTASVNKQIKRNTISEKSIPLFAQSRTAQFRGGSEAMITYLSENIRYPELAIDNNFEGTVKVQFIVLADGSLSDFKVVKSVNELLNASALELIENMPDWKPALQAGRAVKMRVIVPVEFSLN